MSSEPMLNMATLHSVSFAPMIAIMSGEGKNLNVQLLHGTLVVYALLARSRQTHPWRMLGPTLHGCFGPWLVYIRYDNFGKGVQYH